MATTSCNKELNEKVIGEWQCVYLKVGEESFSRDGMKKTFEFFDGTREAEKKIAELFPKYKFLTRGEYIRTLGGVVTRGKWSIKKNKITIDGTEQSVSFGEDNTMTWEGSAGSITTFKKL